MSDIKGLQKAGLLTEVESDGSVLCTLTGPEDTPYVGNRYDVRISLPVEYPFKSPSVGFVHKVYHPNVDLASGTICLNALNHEWTPVYNLVAIMQTLLPQLLTYPNGSDPLNTEAAALLESNPFEYKKQCELYNGKQEAV